MNERRVLTAILLLSGFLGLVYAWKTPVFEASDELWHYPMVRHLAEGYRLPVQVFDPEQAGPWKQEASQPPLYYYLGAILTFWVDTDDAADVRWLNPHVDTGVITADGNINLVVHDPDDSPWQGTLLAVRIVRTFSVLLAIITVYLTYRLAKAVAPTRPEIALGAAAFNAFTPMFLFISGSVNNDNLVIPLASLTLLLLIGLVNSEQRARRWELGRLFLVGLVIGLGALSKITAVGLLPLALGAIWLRRWRTSGRQSGWATLSRVTLESTTRFALVLATAFLIAGWWYARNVQLYGDWSGWNAFIAVLGQRAHPASLAQLWDERVGFMMSYWGLFGGLNVPMPAGIYRTLNVLLVAAVPGFLLYVGRRIWAWQSTERGGDWPKRLLEGVSSNFALVLSALWALAVVVGLVRWATITWSSQGRLVFSAISALSTLMMVGLVGWLPSRIARVVVGGLGLFVLVVAAAAPYAWIAPAYVFEAETPDVELQPVGVDYGDRLRLAGMSVDTHNSMPGGYVDVWLHWQVLTQMEEDWSVFVHLNDPVLEAPIAQRDMYPGQGLLATSLLRPGDEVVNFYRVALAPTVSAPLELDLRVGLYDFFSGRRLRTAQGNDAASLETVVTNPIPGTLPNPLRVDFEGELTLLGYQVERRRVEAGESLLLTMYWEATRDLNRDYTLFAQVVDEDTTRWASQDLAQSTSNWPPGQAQTIRMELPVATDAPAAVYPLIVGAYSRTNDGGFDRLQTRTAAGRLTDDFLELTRVRVD
ncbi:MAG: glycosyltransferase family 39 protein [Candidatus Promineifilaceae bacterium]|nr:glycosyltransferase family 39 protein [Candidatus Promineifilaceae bacterium]